MWNFLAIWFAVIVITLNLAKVRIVVEPTLITKHYGPLPWLEDRLAMVQIVDVRVKPRPLGRADGWEVFSWFFVMARRKACWAGKLKRLPKLSPTRSRVT